MKNLLAFDDFGSGVPLLFMHGLGADRCQTTSALASLPNTRLIAPDFRGHGDSLIEGEELSFDQFADDAIALLDHLGIEKANVGGLSMGSGVCLNIALRYPERVKKLVVLRPSWLDTEQPEHLKLVADAGLLIEEHGVTEGEALLEQSTEYKLMYAQNEQVAKSINGVYARPQAIEAAAVLYKMWQSRPFESLDDLPKVTQQALVLYTSRDDLHPVSVAESVHQQLINSEIVELPARYYDKAGYATALLKELNRFL